MRSEPTTRFVIANDVVVAFVVVKFVANKLPDVSAVDDAYKFHTPNRNNVSPCWF